MSKLKNKTNRDNNIELKIRIAGNTAAPCYAAIKQKGYEVTAYVYKADNNEYLWDWEAKKDTCYFSATSLEELLGLISMWEIRGEKWRASNDEYEGYRRFCDNASVYDDDGNVLKH